MISFTHMISIIIISLVAGFIFKNIFMLVDFCMDYKNYLWKWRYNLAGKYSSEEERDFLKKERAKADQAPNSTEIMMEAYEKIARSHQGFKRWSCVHCFVIYCSCVSIAISFPLVLVFTAEFCLLYPFLTIATVWHLMK